MQMHTATGTLLSLGLILTACSSGDSESTPSRQSSDAAAVDSAGSEHTPEKAGGPLPDGGAASCVESYSPETLQNRDFAFDGTVVRIGPSVSDRGDDGDLHLAGITFEVREWFVGGDADEVTVDLQSVGEGTTVEDPPFQIGTRLLVSGEPRWGGAPLDSPIAWGCGFSRYYDQQTATAWRESTTAPTATMLTNSPVFDDWNDVFRFSSVTVEGTITQRLDTVTIPNDPAVEDIGWAIWELEVNDPLGADVPTTLRVVDFDRNGTQVIDGALPVVEEGLTGIFALDTADAGQRLTFPEVGSTYYPVVILEQTPQGYEHTVGTLPPLESLDEIREAVAADNARNS